MIHPTALIDPSAELGVGVTIGPWAIVGPGVTIGDRCRIGPRATLQRNVRLADGVSVGDGSILGGDPQDHKYNGEETWVEIGEDTIIREFSTINRGTTATFKTTVGARCFIMSYVHLAHDCHVGDDVVIANATQCAGHVTIHDCAMVPVKWPTWWSASAQALEAMLALSWSCHGLPRARGRGRGRKACGLPSRLGSPMPSRRPRGRRIDGPGNMLGILHLAANCSATCTVRWCAALLRRDPEASASRRLGASTWTGGATLRYGWKGPPRFLVWVEAVTSRTYYRCRVSGSISASVPMTWPYWFTIRLRCSSRGR